MSCNIFKKGLVIGTIFFITGLSILPSINAYKLEFNDNKILQKTNIKLNVLSQPFSILIPHLYLHIKGNNDLRNTLKDILDADINNSRLIKNYHGGNRKIKQFFIQRVTEQLNNNDKPLVIVFVNSNLMLHVEAEIDIYSSTLVDVGYDNIVFETSGGTVEDLKDYILNFWNDEYNLVGLVLIGNLPVAWYSHDEDFLCDLFLMDMDGIWIDENNDGLYDSHVDGEGDTAPDIFIGRIDASKVPDNERGEAEIIKKYLYKIHEFWMGNIPQTDIALTYTDREWSGNGPFEHDIGFLYENYKSMSYPNVNKNDYLNNQLSGHYEFIQLTCHSKSFGHLFDDGGLALSNDVRSALPMALFYWLHCCHACKFTNYNCLGNAYILNTNTPSLAVVGSTKSGLMHDFRYFYEPFGQGYSFGQALQMWLEYKYPYNEYEIADYYGVTILGDPTIKVNKNFRADAHGPYYSLINIPISFSGSATGGIPPYTWFWDFGDGNSSNIKNPKYNYSFSGNYTVTFTIKDSNNNTTGDITWVKIKEFNNPPDPPTVSGPMIGKLGSKLFFNLSSIDVDGDEWVEYLIDWGDEIIDGHLGPYKTGDVITFYHRWFKIGTHCISASAKDPYKGGSERSKPFKITISFPRNRETNNSLFLRLLEKFPLLKQLLFL